jgi:nitrogen fixation NifU-like protein
MTDGVEDFVQDLKEKIFEETKKAYGKIAFERWLNPLFIGSMKDPDGYACLRGGCGDTMEFFLKFEDNRVLEAFFQTGGCGSSTVCGSFAAEMAIGKKPDEIKEITGEDVINILGNIPKDDEHLAFLAVETLRSALNDYLMKKTESESR